MATTTHAETVADVRRLARLAKSHAAHCPVSPDQGVEVRCSRAAILDAFKGQPGDTPAGGVYWPTLGLFRLDTTH